MSFEEKLSAQRARRIAEGLAAHERPKKREHFADWLAIADALVAVREEAMDRAHTNRPQGPPYRAALTELIRKHAWMGGIDDTTRTHCYWLIDNLPPVQRWRETLVFDRRDRWNHPSIIKREYQQATAGRETKNAARKKMTLRQLDDDDIIVLEEDTAEDIARMILEEMSDYKANKLIKALQDELKARK